MIKGIVRILAFFGKEISEIRRQPRLVLSLVMGPFLILLIFGLGYSGEQPKLKTILVVPPGSTQDPRVQALVKNLGPNFNVLAVTADQAAAQNRLKRGETDIVEIVPKDVDQLFGRQQQSLVTVLYSQIDPLQEQWIRYLTYVQVKELNTALLLNLANAGKQQNGNLDQYINDARQQLSTIQTGLQVAGNPQTREAIQRLRSNNGLILASLILSGQGGANNQAQQSAEQIQNDLQALESGLASSQVKDQQARLTAIDGKLNELAAVAGQVKTVPAEVLVSPLVPDPKNIANVNYQPSYITFYTPGVVALLLQHMAITLAALSLVRENLLGSVELFRVSPTGSGQIMIGKYFGYTLMAGLIAAALVGALTANIPLGTVANIAVSFGMGVPFVGNPYWFALVTLLLIWASLGIGFLISALSQTESQAVQLSMITLLASVFFSGFFLPLGNFTAAVRGISYLLPVTHGITAYQDIMLRGRDPTLQVLLWLSGIALVCFVLAWALWRRNLRRR